MPVSTTAQNYMLAQETTNKALYVSLHTAYSATGTNELSGGSYARAATAWAAPSGGVISLSNTPVLNVPAANTVRFIGLWMQLRAVTSTGCSRTQQGTMHTLSR